jgi:hypothetical protein
MMRLSDLAAGTGYAWLGIAGTLLALGAFVAIVVWTLRRSRAEIDRWAHQPLEDDGVVQDLDAVHGKRR